MMIPKLENIIWKYKDKSGCQECISGTMDSIELIKAKAAYL